MTVRQLFRASPWDILFRIFSSLVPPFGKRFQKVHVDLIGPLLALLILTSLVNYGYYLKKVEYVISPTEVILTFAVLMPPISYALCRIGQSHISFYSMVSVIGYSLYGHIFTLALSLMCFQEKSNSFFFFSLTVFSGLSTVRVALIILSTTYIPAARLIICSVVSVINILFIIMLHFIYVHPNFVYQAKSWTGCSKYTINNWGWMFFFVFVLNLVYDDLICVKTSISAKKIPVRWFFQQKLCHTSY